MGPLSSIGSVGCKLTRKGKRLTKRKYWLDLLRRACTRALSRAGMNSLGFRFSIATTVLAFTIYIGISWLRNGRDRTAALKAFDTWDNTLALIVAIVFVLAMFLVRSFLTIVHGDHIAQLDHARHLESQLAQSRREITQRSTSQSGIPPQSVYPNLEAIQDRITRELMLPWNYNFTQIIQKYQSYPDPESHLYGGPHVTRSMTQEQRETTERIRKEQHELRIVKKQIALEEAVESLAQLERELGITYSRFRPELEILRKAAADCMNLTEAERISDRSAFSGNIGDWLHQD